VFESRVLRKILGPKGTGENCIMRSLIANNEMGETCSTYGGEESCKHVLEGKHDGRSQL